MSEGRETSRLTALILCHGEPPSAELLARHLASADLVLCTDGAVAWARELGVTPSVVIGDMDSVDRELLPEAVIDAGPHDQQENSDAEKAVLHALSLGAQRIVLLGASGRRPDHSLGNLLLTARYLDQAEVVIADEYGETSALRGCKSLKLNPGATVSLVPLTADVSVVTRGLKWPLRGPLEMGTRGLSNRVVAEEVVIEVRSGTLAVVLLNDAD